MPFPFSYRCIILFEGKQELQGYIALDVAFGIEVEFIEWLEVHAGGEGQVHEFVFEADDEIDADVQAVAMAIIIVPTESAPPIGPEMADVPSCADIPIEPGEATQIEGLLFFVEDGDADTAPKRADDAFQGMAIALVEEIFEVQAIIHPSAAYADAKLVPFAHCHAHLTEAELVDEQEKSYSKENFFHSTF